MTSRLPALCLAASALPFAASAFAADDAPYFRSRRHRHPHRSLAVQRAGRDQPRRPRTQLRENALGINLADDVANVPGLLASATGTTTRRISRSPSAASAPTPHSAFAACASIRTASRPSAPTVRARSRSSIWTRPSAWKSCSGPVLRAVRQFIGRRDPAVHVRRQRPHPAAQHPSRTAASTPSAPA